MEGRLTKGKRMTARQFVSKYGVLLALIAICAVMSFLSDVFFTYGNAINIIRQVAVYGMLAIGETLVILTGEIDLSIGSIVGVSGVSTALCLKAGMSIPVAILIGLCVGMFCGLINGVALTQGNVPSFIATLGMQGVARGFALILSGGYPVSTLGDRFRVIGKGEFFGVIPIPIVILLVSAVIMHFVLKRMSFGRNLFAIGGSRKAALYSGISVKKEIVKAFILSGLFAAMGGIMLAARLNSAETTAGAGYETIAIASVVIGGASLAGGKGSIVGTILGTIIIGVINNAMTLLSVQPYWQEVIQGAIIVLAVLINTVDLKSIRWLRLKSYVKET